MSEKALPRRGRFLPSLLLARWKWLFLLVLLLGIAGPAGLVVTLKVNEPRRFESRTLVEIHSLQNQDAEGFLATALERMTSLDLLQEVAHSLSLGERWSSEEQEVLDALHRHIAVHRRPGTKLVEVSCWHPNAVDARDIVSGLVRAYIAKSEELRTIRGRVTLEVLEKELRAWEDVRADRRKLVNAILEVIHAPEEGEPRSEVERVLIEEDLQEARADYQMAREDWAAAKRRVTELRLALEVPKEVLTLYEQPVIAKEPSPLWKPRRMAGAGGRLVVLALLISLVVVVFLEIVFPARERSASG